MRKSTPYSPGLVNASLSMFFKKHLTSNAEGSRACTGDAKPFVQKAPAHSYIHTYVYIYAHIPIYLCMYSDMESFGVYMCTYKNEKTNTTINVHT